MQSSRHTLTPSEIEAEFRLVQAAQRNPRKFDVLYQRYYQAIFIFIYKRVSDEDQVADLTSQVFLKAMLNLKQYTFKGFPFSAWLYRIAINEVNQFFRQHKRKRTISMEGSQLAEMAEEVTEGRWTESHIQQLVQSLQSLSPAEVQLVELRYFERIPFREIAEIYGITENNAKVRMHRLLGKIRKLMVSTQSSELDPSKPSTGPSLSPGT